MSSCARSGGSSTADRCRRGDRGRRADAPRDPGAGDKSLRLTERVTLTGAINDRGRLVGLLEGASGVRDAVEDRGSSPRAHRGDGARVSGGGHRRRRNSRAPGTALGRPPDDDGALAGALADLLTDPDVWEAESRRNVEVAGEYHLDILGRRFATWLGRVPLAGPTARGPHGDDEWAMPIRRRQSNAGCSTVVTGRALRALPAPTSTCRSGRAAKALMALDPVGYAATRSRSREDCPTARLGPTTCGSEPYLVTIGTCHRHRRSALRHPRRGGLGVATEVSR
jgi:hypothetical protein